MATPAEHVIGKFGSLRQLARALGHTNPTTVQGWHSRGIIPVRQMPAVIEAGRQAGVEITADDFLPTPTQPDMVGAAP